jgi:outer membrane protein insertion porin family
MAALGVAAPTAAAQSHPTAASGPELLLTLSLELSTEKDNQASIVGRAIRTEVFEVGDRLDISQRVGQLRKELGINYVAPTNRLGFQLLSNEFTISESSRFITSSKQLTTAQATYRLIGSRATALGVVGLGFGAEALRLDTDPNSAPYLREYVAKHGRSSTNAPLVAYWLYDRRLPDSILPSGHLDRVNVELAAGIGKVNYAKVDYQHESYLTVSPRLAAGFSATVGALRGLGGDLTPLTKRYFGGGPGTVRGYESGSLSPVDSSGAGIGANRRMLATVEALWHAFSIGETPVVLSVFADHGRFWDTGTSRVSDQTTVSATSYGVGVSLPVRIGLVRFSFAKPKDDRTQTQHFQFEARANWR